MTRDRCPVALLILWAGALGAQAQTRHSLELSAAGLFPISGWKADQYSAGPGLHAGYEFRFSRHLAADAGWTGIWAPGTECSRFGCEHPREKLDFADFGLRGVLPLAAGRAELSAGVGGAHIWFSSGSDGGYYNDWLIQIPPRARWLSIAAGDSESLSPSAPFVM